MKLLKKLNTYLLENYPLAWHSKVIQVILASLLIWGISFVSGYGYVDLYALQNGRINQFYFRSFYVLFHVIYCVIVIALWAISFYKNNAFKSYYPLQKSYFTKLFFHLFIPFLLLVSAYLPFTYGCHLKTSLLFNDSEIKSDIDKLNTGYAFLATDSTNFRINNRIYPEIYRELTINIYDANEEKWRDENAVNEDNTVLVDNHKMQFYTTYTNYLDSNHCKYTVVRDKYYSKEELYNPELFSVLNFSSLLIENNSNSFYQYSPSIFKWVNNKDYLKIEQAINDFKKTCEKYEISHKINTKHLLAYLKYIGMGISGGLNNFTDYPKIEIGYNPEEDINLIEQNIQNRTKTIELMENKHAYYFEKYGLESVFYNYFALNKRIMDGEFLLIFVFLALGLAWLFILFEFANIKNILITIPISGIIIILDFFIVLSCFNNNLFRNLEDHFLNSFILTFTLIIGSTIYGLRTKRINKKYLNILMTMSYIIAPILFVFIMGSIFNDPHYDRYLDKCSNTYQSRLADKPIYAEPGFYFFYSLLGILLFFPLLKKWKAYED
jgi:hypothetical protein